LKTVPEIASKFEKYVKAVLSKRLYSFYVFGSYASGKISEEKPDVNFLLIFEEFTTPQDYLEIGKVCRKLEDEFANKTTIRFEFRPFRYIKPRYEHELEVTINPAITSTGEIKAMGGVIFNKWLTQGIRSSNKLLFGKDLLSTLKTQDIFKEDLVHGGVFDLSFFTLPLSRAPAQYNDDETHLLLGEALTNAKNIASFGVLAAMTEEELKNKIYLEYITDKDKMIDFYGEKYGKSEQKMVSKILEARSNYLKYKKNQKVEEEIFGICLTLGNAVRKKVME